MVDFTCPQCQTLSSEMNFEQNLWVCGSCGYHSRLSWRQRITITADGGSFIELDAEIEPGNPLSFPGYVSKIREAQEKSGAKEAIVTGCCTIGSYPAVVGVMDSHFMMASMGSAVGEKVTRAFEYAAANGLPVIIFTASGGARMQEGIVSLMQMAKTSGAAAKHSRAGQLYITVLTDPTTGGVTASFASLGDIIIAEPKALVGFAGRRVIEGTIGHTLPADFQAAEFVHSHGFVDMIVHRNALRNMLIRLISFHNYEKAI